MWDKEVSAMKHVILATAMLLASVVAYATTPKEKLFQDMEYVITASGHACGRLTAMKRVKDSGYVLLLFNCSNGRHYLINVNSKKLLECGEGTISARLSGQDCWTEDLSTSEVVFLRRGS